MHFKPKHVLNRAYNTECQLSPRVSCSCVTLNPCKSTDVNNPADNVPLPCEDTGCDGPIWQNGDLSTAALLWIGSQIEVIAQYPKHIQQ